MFIGVPVQNWFAGESSKKVEKEGAGFVFEIENSA